MINRETESARQKRKERRSRGSRKYGQAKRKHAKKGIQSCIYAGVTAGILLIMIIVAFVTKGKMGAFGGLVGILLVAASCMGIRAAIHGFREREKNYLTCKLGLGFNIFFLVCLAAIYFGGMV